MEEFDEFTAERRLHNHLRPLMSLMDSSATRWIAATRAGRVDRGMFEEISASREDVRKAIDVIGEVLEDEGIDWNDRRNRPVRRVRKEFQVVFNCWYRAGIDAISTFIESLSGSELEQARRRRDEHEEYISGLNEDLLDESFEDPEDLEDLEALRAADEALAGIERGEEPVPWESVRDKIGSEYEPPQRTRSNSS